MGNKRMIRGVATVLTALFVLVLSLSLLAFDNESDINQILGTSSYKIVNHDDSTDTEYYKKKTASIDEHMNQKLDLIERLVNEGTVLVKNNGVLPLKTEKNVTLLGKTCVDLVYNGEDGNGKIGNVGNTNINLTLKTGLEKSGFTVNPTMWNYYLSNQKTETEPDQLPAGELTTYKDAAIVLLSRNAGEGADAADGYYELTDTELALVEKAKSISDKVIVISNSPSPLSVDALERDPGVDAILVVGGVGAVGVNSLGSILRGTVNPSGKLVDTYAADSRSSAAYQTAGTAEYTNAAEIVAASENGTGEGNTKYVVQKEGIYIGYKYYETRYEDTVLSSGNASSSAGAYRSSSGWNYEEEVTYSFGYGLSYTQFTQAIKSFSVEDGVVNISVEVKNVGSVAGKDVVQLYVQSPYTQYDKTNGIEKSAIQLVNFGKTEELKPGESETVSIQMDLYTIASYDAVNAKTWILDEGTYYFTIGNGAHEALNNVLAAKGKTTANGMDADGSAESVKTWSNSSLQRLDQPTFDESGFTTENGLYHNNTDTTITNRIDSADINNLLGANTVTYLSRSDWQKTWPTGHTAITVSEEMKKRLTFEDVYISESSDTSSITYAADTDYAISMMMGLPYDHELWDKILDQLLIEEMLVTVGKNFGAIDPILGINFPGTSDMDGVGSGPAVKYETKFDTGSTVFEGESKYSAIDARMYPSETVDAATFNQKLIYELGESLSEESYYTGLTCIWGPGLDIHRTPYSGRNFEYFSEDSMLTYILGAQITAAMQSNGMIAGPKHFVCNDAETDRYGYSVYINEQAAREICLRGFEGAVAVGKAKNVMTSLNRVGCDWVGASTALQNDILRSEWGFDGYTLTDNAMGAYMYGRAIALGTDKLMLLPGYDRNAELNKAALLQDATLFAAVREACHRILYVYANSKAMNGVSSNMEIVPVMPWWKTTLVAIDVVLGILSVAGIALFVATELKERKSGRKEV